MLALAFLIRCPDAPYTLAAAASRREEIVPGYVGDDDDAGSRPCAASRPDAEAETAGSKRNKGKRPRPEKMLWAELIQRVFLEDVLRCPCGGRRQVLAMIFNPVSIERVLRHLGLPHEPVPRAPPRPLQVGLPFSG